MNTTNTLLIVIVVLLVGFGVWYFSTQDDMQEQEAVLEVNLGEEEGAQ
ncbi:hypothetical protein K2Y00_00910 [Patescibacteria group bacterium]|nr:hypothetical protein [Patescibacteria group bacterium]